MWGSKNHSHWKYIPMRLYAMRISHQNFYETSQLWWNPFPADLWYKVGILMPRAKSITKLSWDESTLYGNRYVIYTWQAPKWSSFLRDCNQNPPVESGYLLRKTYSFWPIFQRFALSLEGGNPALQVWCILDERII